VNAGLFSTLPVSKSGGTDDMVRFLREPTPIPWERLVKYCLATHWHIEIVYLLHVNVSGVFRVE